MKILKTYLLLASATLFLTGFSWGLGSDPCKEALEIAGTLNSLRDEALMRQAEAKITSQCPDGAAAHFVNALQQERISNFDGAIEEYRRSLQQAPSFARASGNLGLLYAQKGMTDDASVQLARGLASIQNPYYHKAMARILATQKVYPLAAYHYTEAGRELTTDASIFIGLAEVFTALSQPDKAQQEYRRALVADPASAPAHIGITAIYLQRGEVDKALEQLKRGEVAAPQNREIHLMLADIYKNKGDAKLTDYHLLLGGKSKLAQAVQNPATQDGVSGVDKEIGSLKASIKERPEDTLSYEKLGHIYRAAGKDAEAIDAYREAEHRNSTNSDVYLNLGILYEKKGQIDEAAVAYKRAISVNPNGAEAHLRLGDIRFSRGLFQDAVEQYSAFLKVRPESPDIHLKLGRIYAKSKESELAIASYNSVLTYSPNDGDANREIAALYAQKGDNEKALLHYKKALEIQKNDSEARTALISMYVKNKQYDEIMILLKETVELNPDDPVNHYKLGLIYDFKKEYESAAGSYKKAIELKPDNARALNALGRLYMKTGRLPEAKETLEAAKKADPSMEETTVLLNNIRDEFNPEPRKITKGKKGKTKKSKKSSKSSKSTKSAGAAKTTPAAAKTAPAGAKATAVPKAKP
ncbi:MAG TPA: tetratricopeptide repeat protein [Desulfuromonadales bacterium]|nr:tetratricopeptide repeat protein [Desulfuromonadales bacterium]